MNRRDHPVKFLAFPFGPTVAGLAKNVKGLLRVTPWRRAFPVVAVMHLEVVFLVATP